MSPISNQRDWSPRPPTCAFPLDDTLELALSASFLADVTHRLQKKEDIVERCGVQLTKEHKMQRNVCSDKGVLTFSGCCNHYRSSLKGFTKTKVFTKMQK